MITDCENRYVRCRPKVTSSLEHRISRSACRCCNAAPELTTPVLTWVGITAIVEQGTGMKLFIKQYFDVSLLLHLEEILDM